MIDPTNIAMIGYSTIRKLNVYVRKRKTNS